MSADRSIDVLLVQWGERLFYPSNRTMKPDYTPRLGGMLRHRADAIRARIEATVRHTPQVMVRVTGGGRGMRAITAHLRYITRDGQIEIEDDRGVKRAGHEAVRDLTEQWRYGGSLIKEVSHRREAFYLMLTVRVGVDATLLKNAVRDFAHTELAGYRYVMVLHEHQAHPHVHLSVRAESATGMRLQHGKPDLHRWRQTFAAKLRDWGVEAEATHQASRGEVRNFDPLWRLRAKQAGVLRNGELDDKTGERQLKSRSEAARNWAHITQALATSEVPGDRELAQRVADFLRGMPYLQKYVMGWARGLKSEPRQPTTPDLLRGRSGHDVERERGH
ncbi:relaxase/mobilization nuclease domain-containing protein [Burkholderiaceae bacterium UC74_6]